jgi:hypothetical protein
MRWRSDCPHFPCSLITEFYNDGIRHHGEVLEKIRDQREIGVDHWNNLAEYQKNSKASRGLGQKESRRP